MSENKCKHGCESASFRESDKSDAERLDEGRTKEGIWIKHGETTCERFQKEKEQWEKNQGFLMCETEKQHRCCYFEEKE